MRMQQMMCSWLAIIDHHGVASQVLVDVPHADPHSALDDSAERDKRCRNSIGCVNESRDEPNRWMRWAENQEVFPAELMELRNRQVMASFLW